MEQNNINQQPQQHSGLGIAGMIIGIISILFACLAIGGFLGAIGLILSIIGVFQKSRKKGMAIAGIVLNIIAILIMLIMLAAVASSDDDSVKNVTPESQIASTEQNTIEEQPIEASMQENIKESSESSVQSDVFGIGETAEYRNVQVTLVGVNESSGSQYNTPSDGNIFVLPEFEIVNNSDSDLSISSLMTFTAYQDGYSTNLSITALMENTGTQLDGSIAPGKKMKGYIGYEIPAECKELEIHVQTDLLSSEEIVFVYKR